SVVSTGLGQGARHLGGVAPDSTAGSIIDGVVSGIVGEWGGPFTDWVTPEDIGGIGAALVR
ncbi:MAG: hypothetical protein ACYTGU_21100, partial [Planctomycetota bacterium]